MDVKSEYDEWSAGMSETEKITIKLGLDSSMR
jgi:hypothetical protein